MRFVLIDLTQGAQTTSGGVMTPAVLTQIAQACQQQLNTHFSSDWGGDYTVRVGTQDGLEPGEFPFVLVAEFADVPNAIAYHTVNGNGQPLLFDAVTLSDSLAGPGNSVSVAISHELLETAADAGTNAWRDDGHGVEHAQEVCDPVESQSYCIGNVYVTNFVLPAWFTPNAVGPYDYMSRAALPGAQGPSGPLTLVSGGYEIRRTYDQGSEGQVTAHRLDGEPRRPYIAGSRKHRRGLVVTLDDDWGRAA